MSVGGELLHIDLDDMTVEYIWGEMMYRECMWSIVDGYISYLHRDVERQTLHYIRAVGLGEKEYN